MGVVWSVGGIAVVRVNLTSPGTVHSDQEGAFIGLTDVMAIMGSDGSLIAAVTRGAGWLSLLTPGTMPGEIRVTGRWALDDTLLQLETTNLLLHQDGSGTHLFLAGLNSAPLLGLNLTTGGPLQSLSLTNLDAANLAEMIKLGGLTSGTALAALRSGGLASVDLVSGAATTLVHLPPALQIERASALLSVEIGETAFALAAFGRANAVSLFSQDAGGALVHMGDIAAGVEGLPINRPSALGTATVGGDSFVILASSGSGSLTVLHLTERAGITVTDHVLDSRDTRFAKVGFLDVVEVAGHSLVLAAGTDGGLSVFMLLPGGRLHHLASFEGTAETPLSGITAITALPTPDGLRLWISTEAAPFLSELTLKFDAIGQQLWAPDQGGSLTGGMADDILIGSPGDDILSGIGGNNILIDGAGRDTLISGAGADTFIFVPDGETDVVIGFKPDRDRLDLTGLGLQWDPTDVILLQRSWGVELRFSDEVIELRNAPGQNLRPQDITAASFVSLDRISRGLVLDLLRPDPDLPTSDDDTLIGTNGNDTIDGLGGNDVIYGGDGRDLLIGGEGDDTLFGGDGFDTLIGGPGNDRLEGGEGPGHLFGGAGNDTLVGGSGPDDLYGEDGDDTLMGREGDDRLFGGPGNDRLIGGNGRDRLFGGEGDDTLEGGGGFDFLDGGEGNDLMFGDDQADRMLGGPGDDTMHGGNGDDRMLGGDGNDVMYGDDGRDRMLGEAGNDLMFGGRGDDTLRGGDGDDTLYGEAGNDLLIGGTGRDLIFGGAGNDTLRGNGGFDTLYGGEGDDFIAGGAQADHLFGGPGNDTLDGGSGFDRLDGGEGNDLLTGGFNADTFIFADGHGADTITDFDATNNAEKIDFSGLSTMGDIASVLAASFQTGADVLIDTGGGNSILLQNVLLSDLDANDFIF